MIRKNSKGQSIVEYAVLIIVVIGALLTIQNYFKRGLQGRWKSAVDDLGDQYDPQLASSNIRQVLISNTLTTVVAYNAQGGFYSSRSDFSNSIETKTGTSEIGAPAP